MKGTSTVVNDGTVDEKKVQPYVGRWTNSRNGLLGLDVERPEGRIPEKFQHKVISLGFPGPQGTFAPK